MRRSRACPRPHRVLPCGSHGRVAWQAEKNGLEVLGWRDVPQAKQTLGELALDALPIIRQAFVCSADKTGDELEMALYKTRRSTQADVTETGGAVADTYFASFSSRTIVYKGMVQSAVLGPFYTDLQDPLYYTNFAIYHRRFSTNTVPKWPLAQPMRNLAHNGEINTLIGNVNWQRAFDIQRGRRDRLCSLDRSDSANLDAVMENQIMGGKTPAHAIAVLVPEAFRDQPAYDDTPEIVDMLEYYAGMQEAWDGPALLTFCNGKQIGAQLDRNGLRPARLLETKDGLVAMMSETGVVDVPDSEARPRRPRAPSPLPALALLSAFSPTPPGLQPHDTLVRHAPVASPALNWTSSPLSAVPPRGFRLLLLPPSFPPPPFSAPPIPLCLPLRFRLPPASPTPLCAPRPPSSCTTDHPQESPRPRPDHHD